MVFLPRLPALKQTSLLRLKESPPGHGFHFSSAGFFSCRLAAGPAAFFFFFSPFRYFPSVLDRFFARLTRFLVPCSEAAEIFSRTFFEEIPLSAGLFHCGRVKIVFWVALSSLLPLDLLEDPAIPLHGGKVVLTPTCFPPNS